MTANEKTTEPRGSHQPGAGRHDADVDALILELTDHGARDVATHTVVPARWEGRTLSVACEGDDAALRPIALRHFPAATFDRSRGYLTIYLDGQGPEVTS